MVGQIGLAKAIDANLQLLKVHLLYHESDHILNIAYNSIMDGTCLEDIELRRNDEVFLDTLGAQRIPDPTTAGDFCRRFAEEDVGPQRDTPESLAKAAQGVLQTGHTLVLGLISIADLC
jgi:hypothetical protein